VREGSQQLIHAIGSGVDSEAVLGPRGAGLARATDLGLRTPAGFTMSVRSHAELDPFGAFSPALQSQLAEGLTRLEHEVDERLDSPSRPLFLNVSSDRPPTLRGRMLVGLSKQTLPGLETLVGPATATALWLSTLRSFADRVRGIDPSRIEAAADTGEAAHLLALIEKASGEPYPDAGADQLREAIVAEWHQGARATAITVHRSVLPIDERDLVDVCVAFTRNPTTGANEMFGAAPVGGPADRSGETSSLQRTLSRSSPRALEELTAALPLLEVAYKQICTVAFAVEAGQLMVVDVRPTRSSALAVNRLLVELVEEHVLPIDEAILLAPLSAASAPGRTMLAAEVGQVLAGGTGLGRGAAVAPIAVGEGGVRRVRGGGARPILVVDDSNGTSPTVLSRCAGLVIAGSTTCGDPLVLAAQKLGIPVIAGIRRLAVSEMLGLIAFPDATLPEGETLAIDGGSGMIATGGAVEVLAGSNYEGTEILNWCRERAGARIEPKPPAGWSVVVEVDDFSAGGFEQPLLIDLAAAPAKTHTDLLRMVATVPEQLRLGLRPPTILADDLLLPAARWDVVVAEVSPAVELLAAKLAILRTSDFDGA
jgi:pyruvate,orthophosphate dikinase